MALSNRVCIKIRYTVILSRHPLNLLNLLTIEFTLSIVWLLLFSLHIFTIPLPLYLIFPKPPLPCITYLVRLFFFMFPSMILIYVNFLDDTIYHVLLLLYHSSPSPTSNRTVPQVLSPNNAHFKPLYSF